MPGLEQALHMTEVSVSTPLLTSKAVEQHCKVDISILDIVRTRSDANEAALRGQDGLVHPHVTRMLGLEARIGKSSRSCTQPTVEL